MSVHYKFKSNLDHDTVTFDGLSISVADLKKSIMQQKKIGKSSDFDLQITNAQTKEVYDSDDLLIPKNTSVIVARVPVAAGSKKNWDKPDLPLPIDDDDLGQIRYDRIVKNADLVNANASEDDKVKAMITQSSVEYDPTKYVKSRSMTGPLPPTYTCFRCGTQGHWIKNCPTNNPDVKRSTGIPRSFMLPVDGPEHKGALLTSSGDYAVPLIDHQAYKEVKKEKPPFLPQEEPVAEPEAQIPEELLCRVCKDLLQDAVLIHCCGNSFCDECIRQVLLESDNHECPECQEVDVSPDTLIPNRYLRRAVLNFKNQTGYTRAKKAAFIKSPPPERVPSPDSTVESQPPPPVENNTTEQVDPPEVTIKQDIKEEIEDTPAVVPEEAKDEILVETGDNAQPATPPRPGLDEDSQDLQPGTPLADEPPVDEMHHEPLPIQAIGQDHYHSDRYDYHSKYPPHHRDDYRDDRYEDSVSASEPKPISTIATITNMRNGRRMVRPAPVRQQFLPNQRQLRDDRPESYGRDRDDYHRYDRRHERGGPRAAREHSRYNRSPQRYHASDYHHSEEHHESHYEVEYEARHSRSEETHRHGERYRAPPHPVPVPTPVPVYSVPPTVPVPAIIPAAPPVYPPQPPPPGASPIDTLAAQPPPPGVGPLLPPPSVPGEQPPPFTTSNKLYETEESHAEAKKVDDRSIDDKMEAFQRQLEKRDREFSRDRASRSRSRSSGRDRSRSSSRSRSYSSSKSWSRSSSRSSKRSSKRSSTRSSWTRSRTPLSSRSRTRSYTHSRSRSWSKARSYTRSRSRTRTESSRSRSRSRTEPRFRRRFDSRERIRSPPRPRSRSRSFTPKPYRPPPHRNVNYNNAGRHSYTPPHYGASYQYGPPPAASIPPVLRPDYPPHHIHPAPPVVPPVHSRPIDHYPVDRPPKGPPLYPEPYPPAYNVYQQQRYEREPRIHEREPRIHEREPRMHEREPRVPRYDRRQDYDKRMDFDKRLDYDKRQNFEKRQDFEKRPEFEKRQDFDKRPDFEKRQNYSKDYPRQNHPEVIARRIPGYIGNRSRDYEQQRYRPRGPHTEMIRELPQIPEQEIRVVQTKEIPEEPPAKKREEKVMIKHKKHHHHHKTKESKKQESKIPVVVSIDKQQSEPTRNLVKVEVQPDKAAEIIPNVETTTSKTTKSSEKVKDKKHKHKKHKNPEQATKKKKTAKKEKEEVAQGTESEVPAKVKVKKKKVKPKPTEEVPNEPIKAEENSVPEVSAKPEEAPTVSADKPEETVNAVKDASADTLEIFPDEGESALLSSDPVPDADPNEVEVAVDEGEEMNADENAGNMTDEVAEEEEDEEESIEESLHVDVPEMSKWEREELEDDIETRPQRKSAVVVPKEEKEALPSDIIQRAELAILSKPLKPQVALKQEKNDSKASSPASTPDNTVSQAKDPELKSVVKSERLSPALQVTISTTKEKRSVHPKKDLKSSKDSSQAQSRRIKLERSSYAKSDEPPRRIVSTSKAAERTKDSRDRNSDRYERKRSPVGDPSRRTLSSDRRERDYSNRRIEKEREVRFIEDRLREERRHRFADDRYIHNPREFSNTREPVRPDRRRPLPESSSYSRSSRYYPPGRENIPGVERSRKSNFQRSRSRSLESAESYNSYKKKEHFRHLQPNEDSHHRKSSRDHYQSDASDTKHKRKHSPIKPPEKHSESERVSKKPPRRDYHDDLKFEPDYDAFSDNEEKERVKRSPSPEVTRKKARIEKIEKVSQKMEKSSSSEDSSAISESESSDSDDLKSSKKNVSDSDHKQKHKKSKHKKHKKHKHKHKKKKSHKSKKE